MTKSKKMEMKMTRTKSDLIVEACSVATTMMTIMMTTMMTMMTRLWRLSFSITSSWKMTVKAMSMGMR